MGELAWSFRPFQIFVWRAANNLGRKSAGLFSPQEELFALAALKIDDVPSGCLAIRRVVGSASSGRNKPDDLQYWPSDSGRNLLRRWILPQNAQRTRAQSWRMPCCCRRTLYRIESAASRGVLSLIPASTLKLM
jgi:hypothetical protein